MNSPINLNVFTTHHGEGPSSIAPKSDIGKDGDKTVAKSNPQFETEVTNNNDSMSKLSGSQRKAEGKPPLPPNKPKLPHKNAPPQLPPNKPKLHSKDVSPTATAFAGTTGGASTGVDINLAAKWIAKNIIPEDTLIKIFNACTNPTLSNQLIQNVCQEKATKNQAAKNHDSQLLDQLARISTKLEAGTPQKTCIELCNIYNVKTPEAVVKYTHKLMCTGIEHCTRGIQIITSLCGEINGPNQTLTPDQRDQLEKARDEIGKGKEALKFFGDVANSLSKGYNVEKHYADVEKVSPAMMGKITTVLAMPTNESYKRVVKILSKDPITGKDLAALEGPIKETDRMCTHYDCRAPFVKDAITAKWGDKKCDTFQLEMNLNAATSFELKMQYLEPLIKDNPDFGSQIATFHKEDSEKAEMYGKIFSRLNTVE